MADSFSSGLLGRRDALASRRPSVAPLACLVAGRTRMWSASPGECRCGLVPSPTRRGRCKGRCDACSAGVPPAMVCTDADWFYRPRIRIRPLSRSLPLFRTTPSAPAFWAAVTLWRPGDPASHVQRGHWVGIERVVTTLPARRRPASMLEKQISWRVPWSARSPFVRGTTRCR